MNHINLENIHKNFGHIKALNGASITAYEGQITAIVGDNGSGKSTLMNILSGMLKPDSGSITIFGNHYSSLSSQKAFAKGIRMVYQDLALDNEKNSIENIFLGHELMKGPFLDRKLMSQKAEKLISELNINIPDPTVPVRNLSGGQRQALSIARALNQNGRILILDEPTAAMGIKETQSTLELILSLKHETTPVTQLLISHNLFQVFDVADRICVFRAGRCIAQIDAKQSSPDHIHKLLIGQEVCYE
ncbi:MAG: sugar ABC transporter ATP-binding protein [Firmicutes bacterium]|nr:sugar ABC transporter ATP-binding protein [Bacillota bacterium]